MATLPTGAAMAMTVVLTLDWLLAFWMPLVVVALSALEDDRSPAEAAAASTAAAADADAGVADVSSVVGLLLNSGSGVVVRGVLVAEASGGRLAVPVDEMSDEMDERRGVELDGVGVAGDELADDDEDEEELEEVVAAGVELADEDEDEVEDVVPVKRFPKAGSRPPSVVLAGASAASAGVLDGGVGRRPPPSRPPWSSSSLSSSSSSLLPAPLALLVVPLSSLPPLALFVVPSDEESASGGGALPVAGAACCPCCCCPPPPPSKSPTPLRSPPFVLGADMVTKRVDIYKRE